MQIEQDSNPVSISKGSSAFTNFHTSHQTIELSELLLRSSLRNHLATVRNSTTPSNHFLDFHAAHCVTRIALNPTTNIINYCNSWQLIQSTQIKRKSYHMTDHSHFPRCPCSACNDLFCWCYSFAEVELNDDHWKCLGEINLDAQSMILIVFFNLLANEGLNFPNAPQ